MHLGWIIATGATATTLTVGAGVLVVKQINSNGFGGGGSIGTGVSRPTSAVSATQGGGSGGLGGIGRAVIPSPSVSTAAPTTTAEPSTSAPASPTSTATSSPTPTSASPTASATPTPTSSPTATSASPTATVNIAGTYYCVASGDGPCDTTQEMVLYADGSWYFGSDVGTYSVSGSTVTFASPYAGGSGWASAGPADWGPATLDGASLTFLREGTPVRWERS